MKAIETVYNGHKFRSRLEARWAVFFDHLGIEFEYEMEGFILENGEKYLPDFYIPSMKTFIEVKPKDSFEIYTPDNTVEFEKGFDKYAYASKYFVSNNYIYLIAFGDPYDAFLREGKQLNYAFFNGECLNHFMNRYCDAKGEGIWKCKDGDCVRCVNNHAPYCTNILFAFETKSGFLWITGGKEFVVEELTFPFEGLIYDCQQEERVKSLTERSYNRFIFACSKARQARFEYGECG